jgi:hypothetical protein
MMREAPSSYPLAWPVGWPRTPEWRRDDPRFRTTKAETLPDGGERRKSFEIRLPDAIERLNDQLEKIGGRDVVLSTNLELRLDGRPRAGAEAPTDPGVAIYFQLNGRAVVMACDRWRTVAGNVAAIAAHIGAMRDMDRWGAGTTEQLFIGYAIRPAPTVPGKPNR